VSRSCASECTNYNSNGIVNKCCTGRLCNDDSLDSKIPPPIIDQCYECSSEREANCIDGNTLTNFNIKTCPPGTNYCSVSTKKNEK
jgi:hypothetical protein